MKRISIIDQKGDTRSVYVNPAHVTSVYAEPTRDNAVFIVMGSGETVYQSADTLKATAEKLR